MLILSIYHDTVDVLLFFPSFCLYEAVGSVKWKASIIQDNMALKRKRKNSPHYAQLPVVNLYL